MKCNNHQLAPGDYPLMSHPQMSHPCNLVLGYGECRTLCPQAQPGPSTDIWNSSTYSKGHTLLPLWYDFTHSLMKYLGKSRVLTALASIMFTNNLLIIFQGMFSGGLYFRNRIKKSLLSCPLPWQVSPYCISSRPVPVDTPGRFLKTCNTWEMWGRRRRWGLALRSQPLRFSANDSLGKTPAGTWLLILEVRSEFEWQ